MTYEFVAKTHPGLARENNEDSVLVDPACSLAVLADGMGGYNAGEIASGMATSFLGSELGRWLAQAAERASARDIRRALDICVGNANHSILRAAHANAHYAGMGTTLVVTLFHDARLYVGHIGDSRCYRMRDGVFEQITRDHSLLQEQLDAGLITPAQAAISIHRNLVTRALGVEEGVLLDLNDHAVKPGDLYLLCSDGLSDMVDDSAIAGILAAGASLSALADALIDAANANGGRDNISVILARAPDSSGRKTLISKILGSGSPG